MIINVNRIAVISVVFMVWVNVMMVNVNKGFGISQQS